MKLFQMTVIYIIVSKFLLYFYYYYYYANFNAIIGILVLL